MHKSKKEVECKEGKKGRLREKLTKGVRGSVRGQGEGTKGQRSAACELVVHFYCLKGSLE